jgi:hypothetical protein
MMTFFDPDRQVCTERTLQKLLDDIESLTKAARQALAAPWPNDLDHGDQGSPDAPLTEPEPLERR